jgi:hypothetical protein
MRLMVVTSSDRNELWTGQCLCGHITFTASRAPRVHYCHCSMCRRAGGEAFAILAWLPQQSVGWSVGPALRRSSPIAQCGFCAERGTPLTLQYDDSSEIAVLLGAFDRPQDVEPRYHYGVEGRLPWVDIGTVCPNNGPRSDSTKAAASVRACTGSRLYIC